MIFAYLNFRKQLGTARIAKPMQNSTGSMCKLFRSIWVKFGMRQWASWLCLGLQAYQLTHPEKTYKFCKFRKNRTRDTPLQDVYFPKFSKIFSFSISYTLIIA